jgi:hypothetical protein
VAAPAKAAAAPPDDHVDVAFSIRRGDHAENLRKIFSYLSNTPEAPAETRALVKFLMIAALKKPEAIKDSLFRSLGLPPSSWTLEGLNGSLQHRSTAEQESARASFAAMRSVFAEILTCTGPKAVDANEW